MLVCLSFVRLWPVWSFTSHMRVIRRIKSFRCFVHGVCSWISVTSRCRNDFVSSVWRAFVIRFVQLWYHCLRSWSSESWGGAHVRQFYQSIYDQLSDEYTPLVSIPFYSGTTLAQNIVYIYLSQKIVSIQLKLQTEQDMQNAKQFFLMRMILFYLRVPIHTNISSKKLANWKKRKNPT